MKALVTGCAGFIGTHTLRRLLKDEIGLVGIDNLSRVGAVQNLATFDSARGKGFEFCKSDIRSREQISQVFRKYGPFDLIIHLAAQVAVTTSVVDPRDDFETNALGTFNILEAMRAFSPEAFLIFASTNKVYGKMDDVAVTQRNGRYEYDTLTKGIDENQNLDFHSPYGCSKGAADQYVRDYSRIYGLRTVVCRQSCIYGTHQFGVEDQGWIAWFTIASVLDKPLTIFGDGRQSRDILWVEDLVEAYMRLYGNAHKVAGEVFNVGGGSANLLSLLELVAFLKKEGILRRPPKFADWRPGDQKTFVCNVDKMRNTVGWEPKVAHDEGIKRLIDWTVQNEPVLETILK
jgi:CDP-paratose 2-epimerase